MKKIKIFLILIILIIIMLIAYSSYVVYQHLKYSLDEVCQMLNSARLPENVYIKYCSYSKDFTTYLDTYIKDGKLYTYQKTLYTNSNINYFESIYTSEENKSISINNLDKSITIYSGQLQNSYISDVNFGFFNSVQQHGKYEHRGIYNYCGKEKVNENNCIKVSLKIKYDDLIDIEYYYIDLNTNLILKREFYRGSNIKNLEIQHLETYEYYFDTLKDEDIPKFDINDYSDYTFNYFE